MSETAGTLINASLRILGVYPPGFTPTTSESASGLEALQRMLHSWFAHGLMISFIDTDDVTLTGASSYSIGSGGTVNTIRPTEIVAASTSLHVLEIIDIHRYRRYSVAGLAGPTRYLHYTPEFTLGYLKPYPLESGETMTVESKKPLIDPAATSTSMAIPDEYEEAIVYNLAKRLAPEYGKNASQEIWDIARESKAAIETRNFANHMGQAQLDILGVTAGAWNIDRG